MWIFIQTLLTKHRLIKQAAVRSSVWMPQFQWPTAVWFWQRAERSTLRTGSLQPHQLFTFSLSQFSAVNHRSEVGKKELRGSESCCNKDTAWVKSSISVSLLPESQRRAVILLLWLFWLLCVCTEHNFQNNSGQQMGFGKQGRDKNCTFYPLFEEIDVLYQHEGVLPKYIFLGQIRLALFECSDQEWWCIFLLLGPWNWPLQEHLSENMFTKWCSTLFRRERTLTWIQMVVPYTDPSDWLCLKSVYKEREKETSLLFFY